METKKTFDYLNFTFLPVGYFSPNLSFREKCEKTKSHDYFSPKAYTGYLGTPNYDHDNFYAAAKTVGAGEYDIFKEIKSGLYCVPTTSRIDAYSENHYFDKADGSSKVILVPNFDKALEIVNGDTLLTQTAQCIMQALVDSGVERHYIPDAFAEEVQKMVNAYTVLGDRIEKEMVNYAIATSGNPVELFAYGKITPSFEEYYAFANEFSIRFFGKCKVQDFELSCYNQYAELVSF